MDKITVIAKDGCRCPRERRGDPAITDREPVEVKLTPYYVRLIADGSLRKWQTPKAAPKKTTKEPEKTGGDK